MATVPVGTLRGLRQYVTIVFLSQTDVGCLDMAWDLWRTGWHSDTLRFDLGSLAFPCQTIIPPMLHIHLSYGGCTNGPLEAETQTVVSPHHQLRAIKHNNNNNNNNNNRKYAY
jgi:hypothetical protein